MEKQISNQISETKAPSTWGWIFPVLISIILVKTVGGAGALVTLGSYYWLQPKIGTFGAVVLSGVLGVVAAIGFIALFINLN